MESKLPGGWKKIQLIDLVEPVETINPSQRPDDEFVYLDIDSIDNSVQMVTNPKKYLGKDAPSRARQLIRRGDILFSTVRPYLKNVAQVQNNHDGDIASTGFCVVRPSCRVNGRYLFYYLISDYFMKSLEKYYRGANYPAITDSALLHELVPLPPLNIQDKIVTILDKAEKIKRLRAQANDLTQKLLLSVFLEMFGDPISNNKNLKRERIDRVVNLVSSGSTPLGGSEVYQDQGILFIRSQNVRMNQLTLDDAVFISEDVHNQMKRTWLRKGDVLFNITGASIGRVAWFDGEDDSANVNQHVCIIRPIQGLVLPEFLSYQMSLPTFQQHIMSRQSGATRQAFNFAQIRDFEIILPDIKTQKKFAQEVRSVLGIDANQTKAQKHIFNLFDTIMNKSFTGELVA